MEVSSLPRRGGRALSPPRQVLKAFGDDRLVEQIRRGNDAAFEVAYERHHRAILSFCRHMLSSQHEAEDVVQQAFVSAYYDLRSSDKPITLKPWLYTIARNRCLSVLRARREQPAELDDISTAGLADSVQERDDLKNMLADMRLLPDDQRAALVLSELGDLAHAEIAGVIGCETPKVKSLVFQARSSLIESRQARETPCHEIREQLATLRGGSLRRGTLRKHLGVCPGCREFREEVRRQRAAAAVILPVVPTAGLKGAVMAATGIGGGAAGGAAGIAAGGAFATAASSGATKLAAVAAIAAGTVGAGVVVKEAVVNEGAAPAPASPLIDGGSPGSSSAAPPGSLLAAGGAAGPMVDRDRTGRRRASSAKAEAAATKTVRGKKGGKKGAAQGGPGGGAADSKSGNGQAKDPDNPSLVPGPAPQAADHAELPGSRGRGDERGRAGGHGGRHGEKDLPGGKHTGKPADDPAVLE
jgi:RNA polymerase sigma factor (sigma-70 family)